MVNYKNRCSSFRSNTHLFVASSTRRNKMPCQHYRASVLLLLLVVSALHCQARDLRSSEDMSGTPVPPCPDDEQNNPTTVKEISSEAATEMDPATTICPEELKKQQEEAATSTVTMEATTPCPEEEQELQFRVVPSSQELHPEEQTATTDTSEEPKEGDNNPEPAMTATTECPEELKKREKNKNTAALANLLLNVQKDSALLKLVQSSGKTEVEQHRRKRQTPSYYTDQQELEQRQPSRTAANYPAYNNNIRTYQQQMQRQYPQAVYPKSYQRYNKPVKAYQNPVAYARYPSNGSVKQLYQLNGNANRRQFQQQQQQTNNVRQTSSTATPTRKTTKKFRPMPVFA